MPRETNTLPTAKPLHSREKMKALVRAGVPGLRAGLGAKVFDCAGRFCEALRKYPKVGRCVALYHPDMQGPIDAAEVVWGSDIFLAFYEEPELLKEVLELITQTYAAFMRKWHALVPPAGGESVHWELMHRGRLMIRNDSLMNLSPDLYVEYIRPLDQRLFDEFGGGAVHFCGKGSHYIAAMSEVRGLYGIQMSQPHLNNMETIYRNTVDKGIPLLSFDRKTAEAAKAAGRKLHGRVQC
jgi:uroporphyrinogen-III decarboxylase